MHLKDIPSDMIRIIEAIKDHAATLDDFNRFNQDAVSDSSMLDVNALCENLFEYRIDFSEHFFLLRPLLEKLSRISGEKIAKQFVVKLIEQKLLEVGLLYFYGVNSLYPRNYILALERFDALAKEGNALSQACLGLMHAYGLGGLVKNENEAVRLCFLSASQGNGFGQAGLGFMHAHGLGGLVKNENEAVILYSLSAAQGNALGQLHLGFMHAHGLGGLVKNENEAVRLFSLSAAQGCQTARHLLMTLQAKLNPSYPNRALSTSTTTQPIVPIQQRQQNVNQGLKRKRDERDDEIKALRQENANLTQRLNSFEQKFEQFISNHASNVTSNLAAPCTMFSQNTPAPVETQRTVSKEKAVPK